MISANSIQLHRDGRTIVETFSLNILPGKIHALIGPNGCGKSTALSALAGDSSLYSGEIFVDGTDQEVMSIQELAQKRAVVLQSQKFLLGFQVHEVLDMAIHISGGREDIEEAAEALAILPLMNRKVTSLSGGERQRVAIAMGLAQATPYLLLDEPFSAQDVESVARISRHLRFLAEAGKGVLLVAHMSELELAWCDEITHLSPSLP